MSIPSLSIAPVSIALVGTEPGLAAVLAEYAAAAVPPLALGSDPQQAALVIYGARDKQELAAHLKQIKAGGKKIALLILKEGVPEPEDEAGLAGIFRSPVRLPALLDAGFSALRLAGLKEPRALSKTIRFDPFTRALEDTEKGISETLTPKEADLLLALLEAGEAGLPRASALTRIWGYHREVDSHAVETAAWRLRRKLESLCGDAASLESRDQVFYLNI
jgi:hypothetical protein